MKEAYGKGKGVTTGIHRLPEKDSLCPNLL